MRKLELVIDAGSLPTVREIINKSGAKGFTVVNVIEGKGEEGYKKAIPELNSLEQYYVFVICSAEESKKLVDGLTPYISSVGGVLFTSTLDSYISK
jgi:nitrogen regulatory protein PII